MDITREQRKQQWEILERTTSGRERIIDAYEQAMNSIGAGPAAWVPFGEMIDAILDVDSPDSGPLNPPQVCPSSIR